jgi:hypothetical protein
MPPVLTVLTTALRLLKQRLLHCPGFWLWHKQRQQLGSLRGAELTYSLLF